ncbi:MAG: hypothetical protein WDM85_18970 [Caulobacteraceae bacterium]
MQFVHAPARRQVEVVEADHPRGVDPLGGDAVLVAIVAIGRPHDDLADAGRGVVIGRVAALIVGRLVVVGLCGRMTGEAQTKRRRSSRGAATRKKSRNLAKHANSPRNVTLPRRQISGETQATIVGVARKTPFET